MLTFDGMGIRLTRGDSVHWRVRIRGRELPDGTEARFTVKRRPWALGAPLIQKTMPVQPVAGEDKTYRVDVHLSHEDTNLKAGNYVWDVRLVAPGEGGACEVYTPMECANFCVAEGIGEVEE